MVRMSLATLSMLGLLAVSSEAKAEDFGPYMWGAGVKVGTTVVPGRYPYAFPSKVANYDFLDNGARAGDEDSDEPKRDLDANGDPRFSTLDGAGFDLRLGGEGFYGINRDNRLGAGVGFGAGGRYFDTWITLNYDRRLWGDSPFDLIAGAKLGYGYARWGGNPDEPGGENEVYKMTNFPLQGHIAGQFRNKTQMYGLGIFAGTAIPGNTTYLDLDGEQQDAVGGPGNFALHLNAGLELEVMFGDFTAPKEGKGGKGKDSKGGKGGKDAKGGKGGKGGKSGKGGKANRTEGTPDALDVTEASLIGMGTESSFLLIPPAGLLLLGFGFKRRK
jgi:hypothetical protein